MGRLWGVPVPIRPPPFTSPSLPSIPSSNHPPPPPGSVCFLPRADQFHSGTGILGFAIHSQARHGGRPNRVRHPPDYSFTSGCFPPLLTETQLPSVTGLQTIPRQGLPPCWLDALGSARVRHSGAALVLWSAALPCRFGSLECGSPLPLWFFGVRHSCAALALLECGSPLPLWQIRAHYHPRATQASRAYPPASAHTGPPAAERPDRRRTGDGASVPPPGSGGEESPASLRPHPAACAEALSRPAAPSPSGEPGLAASRILVPPTAVRFVWSGGLEETRTPCLLVAAMPAALRPAARSSHGWRGMRL